MTTLIDAYLFVDRTNDFAGTSATFVTPYDSWLSTLNGQRTNTDTTSPFDIQIDENEMILAQLNAEGQRTEGMAYNIDTSVSTSVIGFAHFLADEQRRIITEL